MSYVSPWLRVLKRRVLDAVCMGAPVVMVAHREGLAPETVRAWCEADGVAVVEHTPAPQPATPLDRALQRVADGATYYAAAKAEGLSQTAVYRYCKRRAVISQRPASRTYERSVRDSCVRAVRAGLSQSETSRRFGVPQNTVSQWCIEEGIRLQPKRICRARGGKELQGAGENGKEVISSSVGVEATGEGQQELAPPALTSSDGGLSGASLVSTGARSFGDAEYAA